MFLKLVKELLHRTGDLREIKRENGEIRITDLYLNGYGYVNLEQYSTFSKEDLQNHAKNSLINREDVQNLESELKLWTLYSEEDSDSKDYEVIVDFFKSYTIETLMNLPKMDFYDPIISFLNSREQSILFIAENKDYSLEKVERSNDQSMLLLEENEIFSDNGNKDYPTLDEIKRDYNDLIEIIGSVTTLEQVIQLNDTNQFTIEIDGMFVEDFIKNNGMDEKIEWIRYEAFGCLAYIYVFIKHNEVESIMFDVWSNKLDNTFLNSISINTLTEEMYVRTIDAIENGLNLK